MLAHLFLLFLSSVATETTHLDSPQPGFGALIAIVAILVALIVALHKRRQYTDNS